MAKTTTATATPYDGLAPLNKVISVLRRFEGCEYRSAADGGFSRWSPQTVEVTCRKVRDYQASKGGVYVRADVVEVLIGTMRRDGSPYPNGSEAEIVAHLRSLGWTVEYVQEGTSWNKYHVYGPGREEWFQQAIAEQRAAEQRKQAEQEDAVVKREHIEQIFAEAGLGKPVYTGYSHAQTSVVLTYEQLLTLIGQSPR